MDSPAQTYLICIRAAAGKYTLLFFMVFTDFLTYIRKKIYTAAHFYAIMIRIQGFSCLFYSQSHVLHVFRRGLACRRSNRSGPCAVQDARRRCRLRSAAWRGNPPPPVFGALPAFQADISPHTGCSLRTSSSRRCRVGQNGAENVFGAALLSCLFLCGQFGPVSVCGESSYILIKRSFLWQKK